MPTVEDLVVRARPEGLGETTDGIEQMESGISESADSMGDASDQMDELSSRWQGAFKAMVAGMAVAVGGLLSKVPVVGELMMGLDAILEAFGFQVDQLLRDLGMGGLTGTLFEWADAIYEADGALGDLLGALALLGTAVLGGASAWFLYTAATQGFLSALAIAGGKIMGFLGTLSGLVTGSAIAAGAFGAFIGVLGVGILEITGVMDAVEDLGRTIGQKLPGWARDGLTALIGIFAGPLAIIGGAIAGFVEGYLEGGISAGIDRAVQNAKDVLGVFVGAWSRTLGRIKSKIRDFMGWVGRKFEKDIVAGVSVNDVASGIGDFAGGISDVASSSGFRAGRSETPVIQIDGKDITESTGRWRQDETSRRGVR